MQALKVAFLNIVFYSLFFLFSSVAIPALGLLWLIFVIIFPRREAMKRLRREISWYGAVVIRILPFPFVRLSVKDLSKENIPGPYLFVCNHRSASDPFLLAVFPYEIVQIVNIWPFKLPALGFAAKLAGYLSVREMPFEVFFNRTSELINAGASIAAFPEGTRSRNNSLGQFHGAVFRVALATKIPIVPVCITGNENIPPVGSPFLRPGVIKIHRLPALTYQEYAGFTPYKLKNHVRDILVKEALLMDQEK